MTAEKVLNVARAEIGVKESPANSNNVKYNTKYYGREVNGSAYPWCCAFIWWVFNRAGASNLFCNGKKTALCEYVRNAMKSQIVKEPKSGDLVLYQFDRDPQADHIGIIETVNADGTFTAIEGNTSLGNDSNGGMVMRRTRKRSSVICFIRPKYKDNNLSVVDDNKKTDVEIALEVTRGLWGNGADRKNRLVEAGYDPKTIQALVNQLLRG